MTTTETNSIVIGSHDVPINGGFGDAYGVSEPDQVWDPAAAVEALVYAWQSQKKSHELRTSLAKISPANAVTDVVVEGKSMSVEEYADYLDQQARQSRAIAIYNGGAAAVEAWLNA